MNTRIAAGYRGLARQQGFTLIEVIVAFALLALALTLLLGSLSGAARQIQTADRSTRASLHAQSLLSQLGVAQPLQVGTVQGEFEDGQYHWTLDVQRYVDPLVTAQPVGPSDIAPPQLLQFTLTTRWGEQPAQAIVFHGLRQVPPQTAGVAPP
ncbi:hypothetical protein ABB29_09310 [Pseudoxanthomonas dokdonensis]|uniref:General secretion pathway protein GspI n=1 Tax=Pseudoxanthomonas dokdonensis TaxID=344882 RepID=A0A0R0CK22_9GAMM|nr:hypothetical protein ABB29_09310 [Pseudoxanthomonas dokdonensis]